MVRAIAIFGVLALVSLFIAAGAGIFEAPVDTVPVKPEESSNEGTSTSEPGEATCSSCDARHQRLKKTKSSEQTN